MTRPVRLPQIPQAEKDRRAAARKEEMAVWEHMRDIDPQLDEEYAHIYGLDEEGDEW